MSVKTRYLAAKAAVGSALMGAAVAANADVPAEVTTGIKAAFTDAGNVAGVVIVGFAGLFVYKLIRRFL